MSDVYDVLREIQPRVIPPSSLRMPYVYHIKKYAIYLLVHNIVTVLRSRFIKRVSSCIDMASCLWLFSGYFFLQQQQQQLFAVVFFLESFFFLFTAQFPNKRNTSTNNVSK